jgi:hypothetical protein
LPTAEYFPPSYWQNATAMPGWLGTWHDGTKEGDHIMQERFKPKRDRMNAKMKEKQAAGAE